jgi:hypothetical protein
MNLALIGKVLRKINANLVVALSGYDALGKLDGFELAPANVDVHMPNTSVFIALKKSEEKCRSESLKRRSIQKNKLL